MKNSILRASLGALAVLWGTAAGAQVQAVSAETFEYAFPGMLHLQNGGNGWFNEWFVVQGQGDVSLFDSSVVPAFPLDDGVGVYAGQVVPFGEAYRKPDVTPHPDLSVGNAFGADDTTMWVSFSTQLYVGSTDHFGGLALIEQGVGEQLFLGSPWQTNGWGIDDEGPNGAPAVGIAGTDNTQATRIVTRIDFMTGMERVRMYLNPSTEYPTGAADLDEMVHDFIWNEIRLSSGGNNGEGFYFDNVVIAKGDPSATLGTNYCGPSVANSTGASAILTAQGSNSVATNGLTLSASALPINAFGFFLASQTQGFVMNPGGSAGNLCLGGAIGRYVGAGQIQNSGQAGAFSLTLDLAMVPQPSGFVSVAPGDNWNFQTWYRDSVGGTATSNFTDGVNLTFLP